MSEFLSRRMARKPFWLLVLANTLLASAVQWLLILTMRHLYAGAPASLLQSPLWFFFSSPACQTLLYLPSFVAASWRLHDTGRSGAWAWVALACKAGTILIAAAAGVGSAKLYMQAAHTQSDAAEAIAIFGGYFGILFANGPLLWLAYICAQPSGSGPGLGDPLNQENPSEPMPLTPPPSPAGETVAKLRPATSTKPRSFGRRAS